MPFGQEAFSATPDRHLMYLVQSLGSLKSPSELQSGSLAVEQKIVI